VVSSQLLLLCENVVVDTCDKENNAKSRGAARGGGAEPRLRC